MKWAGHVARNGEKVNAYGVLMGKQQERLGADGQIIINLILEK
jgi:hypothetical protein